METTQPPPAPTHPAAGGGFPVPAHRGKSRVCLSVLSSSPFAHMHLPRHVTFAKHSAWGFTPAFNARPTSTLIKVVHAIVQFALSRRANQSAGAPTEAAASQGEAAGTAAAADMAVSGAESDIDAENRSTLQNMSAQEVKTIHLHFRFMTIAN